MHLHRWNSQCRHGGQCLQQMSQNVNDGNRDDCLELSEELVCNHCAKNWTEVAQHGEGVIYRGGSVLGEVKFLVEIDGEDSFHPIVRKPLAELISDNKENLFGIFEFHLQYYSEFIKFLEEVYPPHWETLERSPPSSPPPSSSPRGP